MNRRKTLVGLGLILALMALTGWVLLKDLPLGRLAGILAGCGRAGWCWAWRSCWPLWGARPCVPA